jgi:hypothetical protein
MKTSGRQFFFTGAFVGYQRRFLWVGSLRIEKTMLDLINRYPLGLGGIRAAQVPKPSGKGTARSWSAATKQDALATMQGTELGAVLQNDNDWWLLRADCAHAVGSLAGENVEIIPLSLYAGRKLVSMDYRLVNVVTMIEYRDVLNMKASGGGSIPRRLVVHPSKVARLPHLFRLPRTSGFIVSNDLVEALREAAPDSNLEFKPLRRKG